MSKKKRKKIIKQPSFQEYEEVSFHPSPEYIAIKKALKKLRNMSLF